MQRFVKVKPECFLITCMAKPQIAALKMIDSFEQRFLDISHFLA
jgi:hypothetical protein